MNRLIIIGNGFDLAHGLKTKYSNFILSYFNDCIDNIKNSNSFSDNLVHISSPGINSQIHEFSSIKELSKFAHIYSIRINFKFQFIEDLVREHSEDNWVDIEEFYYQKLMELTDRYIKNPRLHQETFNQVVKLNNCLDYMKEYLTKYLSTLPISEEKVVVEIKNHFKKLTILNASDDRIFVLNFNYTNMVDFYFNSEMNERITIINIHGKLNSDSNPIIFGYGDEQDRYEVIEKLNKNEFIKHIKSFGYFKTKNYRLLTSFLDSARYEVAIMGHSCGISDRILLNHIFQNDRCRSIQLFYYKIDEHKNDFIEKTMDISRHFSSNAKGTMRKLIVPFSESKPLLDYPQNN